MSEISILGLWAPVKSLVYWTTELHLGLIRKEFKRKFIDRKKMKRHWNRRLEETRSLKFLVTVQNSITNVLFMVRLTIYQGILTKLFLLFFMLTIISKAKAKYTNVKDNWWHLHQIVFNLADTNGSQSEGRERLMSRMMGFFCPFYDYTPMHITAS